MIGESQRQTNPRKGALHVDGLIDILDIMGILGEVLEGGIVNGEDGIRT